MQLSNIAKRIGIIAAIVLAGNCAHALNTSHYASTSKLASGRWVKITVDSTGVYELTAEQLQEMGFSDPDKVRIYGNGGNMMSEIINASQPDDLVKVPVMRKGGKLYFYAKGPVAFSLTDPQYGRPHYVRTMNAYDLHGHYFITDSQSDDDTMPTSKGAATEGTVARSTSHDYYYHERDINYINDSGKSLLGEDMTTGSISFNYTLPGLCLDSTIYVNPSAASNNSSTAYLTATICGTEVPFTLRSARMQPPASSYIYFNTASPAEEILPAQNAKNGTLQLEISTSGTINNAKLDYFILSYYHTNTFDLGAKQLRIGLATLRDSDRIDLINVPQNTVLWDISNEQSPVICTTSTANVEADSVNAAYTRTSFTPGVNVSTARYIAFDTDSTMMQIAGFETVDNQNLHALTTPDMLIITNATFAEQAERVATLHREHDNLDVTVVDQQQIFNEFSSGNRDAMAYRLLAKMLYDRNPSKLRSILLMGPGSFDNRSIFADRSHMLLTYQSNNSSDESQSYTSDDFFGILADGSGDNITGDLLTVAVGRIPSINVDEAQKDVDKLIKYVTEPDYGAWRNNFTLWADQGTTAVGDFELYEFQNERNINIFENEQGNHFNISKVYVSQYPRAVESGVTEERRTASEAKRKINSLLNQGQYFASYTGHAGPSTFTRTSHMWTTADVQNASYSRLPIMTTAACDVARFDSDSRGIAEYMFHKTDGGAIALMTSARSVYATSNDILNKAFLRNCFVIDADGNMPTLGHAYLMAKRHFGSVNNTNKMSFFLLGDPEIQINFPRPQFKVTAINGTEVTDGSLATTAPLTKLSVEASVMKADGTTVDDSFNGPATLSLYDVAPLYGTTSQYESTLNATSYITLDITYPRDLLASVEGEVVNGKFTGSVVVPQFCKAQGDSALVRIYAHKTGTDYMVNGSYGNIVINSADDATALTDTIAPVITLMAFEGSDNATVGSSATLLISATDDTGINTQALSMGNGMDLILDGTTHYATVSDYATLTDGGASLDIAMPLTELKDGRHSIEYTVTDVAGNSASRTLEFIVLSNQGTTELTVDTDLAVEKVTFGASSAPANGSTTTITIQDAAGTTVYKNQVDLPFEWNITDNDGKRLPAGRYSAFGTIVTTTGAEGTPITTFTVIDPVKRAN